MQTVQDYIDTCPQNQLDIMLNLKKAINENLQVGFQHCLNYGMLGWVVPHSRYPSGYHCNPKLPLPFINLAYRKGSINLYHSGIYAIPKLHYRFVEEYSKHSKKKLDMGKSCIRFKHYDDIPYALIEELCRKISVDEWINIYESAIKK